MNALAWSSSVVVVAASLVACGQVAPADESARGLPGRDGTIGPRSTASGVGSACTPAIEDGPSFAGFDDQYTYLETRGRSGEPVCLIDHFRGRVSCPLGQDADGAGFSGGKGCTTPGGDRVVGGGGAWPDQWVEPQCRDRRSEDVVYTSCRCANADGRTDDGDTYCTCPDALACKPLVSMLGIAGELRTGSYCMKDGPTYDPKSSCSAVCTEATCP